MTKVAANALHEVSLIFVPNRKEALKKAFSFKSLWLLPEKALLVEIMSMQNVLILLVFTYSGYLTENSSAHKNEVSIAIF